MRLNAVANINGQRGPRKKERAMMRAPVTSGSTLVMEKMRIDKMRAPRKDIRRTIRGGRKTQVAAKTIRPPAVEALAMMP